MALTNDRARIKKYRANWRDEINAVYLYEALAKVDAPSQRSDVLCQLAEVEKKHAAVWEGYLKQSGSALPTPGIHWRTRVLAWLGARFGLGLVLPSLASLERGAVMHYDDQVEAVALRMPQEERTHAKVLDAFAESGRGASGGSIAEKESQHRTFGGNALRAGVLGANDGLVSNLSLVMGVAGVHLEGRSVLVAGVAGLLAGAISMALGEWLSVQSSRELYARQIDLEKSELEINPTEEKEELALIYQAKGLPEAEARNLAERLLADSSHALDTLVKEELSIDPEELGGSAWEAATASFLLFACGAAFPVIPFFFFSGWTGVFASLLVSTLGLFLIGAGITLVTGKSLWLSGGRQIVFGLAAAAVTFGLGSWVGTKL